MIEELKKTILAMLAEHNTMTIASINQTGKPEAAAVFYVNRGFSLFFFSNPASRHAQNIGKGSYCAMTIQQDYSNWQEIKGLQLEGEIVPVKSSLEKAAIIKMYVKKYGFLNKALVEGNKLFDAFNKAKIYKVSPEVIWLTDNNYGFGQRRLLKLNWSTTDPVGDTE